MSVIQGELQFAQNSTYSSDEAVRARQSAFCEGLGLDYDEVLRDYEATVLGGSNVTPFLLRVVSAASDRPGPSNETWSCVMVEVVDLGCRISSTNFLRLRPIPETIAAQFKGTVAPGRHLQELPKGSAEAIRRASQQGSVEPLLRKYTVVEAQSAVSAKEVLAAAGRDPLPGDRAFLIAQGGLLGVHVESSGDLLAVTEPIPRTPSDLLALFDAAGLRATPQDYFTPKWARVAAEQLKDLIEGPGDHIALDDFARFHDCYELLPQKITQALEIAKRDLPTDTESTPSSGDFADAEIDELANLAGLTVDAVRAALPVEIVLPDSVIAEAVTALRAGKHLLLGGPPGTGKTTLAEALCRAVVAAQYDVATATADWSTFDTIGGYLPSEEGLRFEAGVVLRALRRGHWLVIDEINRADIDKAFGPLFTLLASSAGSGSGKRVVLPYTEAGRHIEIRASAARGADDKYVVTPGWRLVGTLNLSDKASLFQLSFAFLRRFAVVNVPLPDRDGYIKLMTTLFGDSLGVESGAAFEALADLAFGPRQLGPAIVADIALFVEKAVAEDAAGRSAYQDPIDALVTAVRLFAVPQYEGASKEEGVAFVNAIASRLPSVSGAPSLAALRTALAEVAL